MNTKISEIIAQSLGIATNRVDNTILMLDEGATIPFISRYRKERTGSLDEVQILQIKELYEKFTELEKRKEPLLKRESPRSEKVAVIGAGPAGLSCAYYLGLKGYSVTIFERLAEPGGMAAVGIPDYRLPRDILRYEAGLAERLGVDIRYNTQVGKDITLSQIFGIL